MKDSKSGFSCKISVCKKLCKKRAGLTVPALRGEEDVCRSTLQRLWFLEECAMPRPCPGQPQQGSGYAGTRLALHGAALVVFVPLSSASGIL